VAVVLSGALAYASNAFAQQFVYVYTRARQIEDLKRITNFVADR